MEKQSQRPLQLTLDANIVFKLETKRDGYENVLKIIELSKTGEVIINIPASMAAEKWLAKNNETKPNIEKNHTRDIQLFFDYLKGLGFEKYVVLKPGPYVGIMYHDYCISVEMKEIELEEKIHKIVFNEKKSYMCEYKVDLTLSKELRAKKWKEKWLNPKCDVLALWCHCYYKKDIFVTEDGPILEKREELIKQVSAKEILTPKQLMEQIG